MPCLFKYISQLHADVLMESRQKVALELVGFANFCSGEFPQVFFCFCGRVHRFCRERGGARSASHPAEYVSRPNLIVFLFCA